MNSNNIEFEEHVSYMGWQHCLRISNTEVEMIVATEIGLRILYFGFIGGENIFYLSSEDLGKQGGDEWRIYGGHRLWQAPEELSRTYYPDNYPVSYTFDGRVLRMTQPEEKTTGIVKEMEILLFENANRVQVLHRLINQSDAPVSLSCWAISALAAGGTAIVPQEPYGEGDEYLIPTRSLALWSYTKMNDPRWTWGEKYIQAKQDPALVSEQKIGLLNKQGWAVYCQPQQFFLKTFDFDPSSAYADYGSNNEIYMNGFFLEVETLGAHTVIAPKEKREHTEQWQLGKGLVTTDDSSIEKILPLIKEMKNFSWEPAVE